MRILIADKYPNKLKEELEKTGNLVYMPEISTKEQLKKEVRNIDILVVRSKTKVDKEIIDCAKKLKYVITGTHGTDHIDCEYLNKKNIRFDNIAEQDISVAEHVFALLLNLARDISLTSNYLKNGINLKDNVMGIELHNKILGVIGYGKIGKKVAEIAKGFRMKVLSYDVKDMQDENSISVGLEELLKTSDFITIHVPLTEETNHLIGEKEINQMKKGVYFINASRGGVVDENALYSAVVNDKIAKVGLDVSENPVDINNPWLSQEKVVVTPHIGGQTSESRERTIDKIIEKVAEFSKQIENGL